MKYLLPFVLFSSLIIGGHSALFFERLLSIPGHEDQCYDKEENVFYKNGEEMTWRANDCGQKTCSVSGGKAYVEIQTCGKVGVPSECYTVRDLNLPYPKCCERIVCPELADLKKNSLFEDMSSKESEKQVQSFLVL